MVGTMTKAAHYWKRSPIPSHAHRSFQHMTEWPNRGADEVGWCYYVLSGDDLNEAISLVVALTPYHSHTITAVEFGRP